MKDLYLVYDGEVANCPKDENGQLDLSSGQAYDSGWQVVDNEGKVYCERSFVNSDVFYGMPQAMQEAYFADKIPQYQSDINEGKRKVLNTWGIWRQLRNDCERYHIKAIIAHNARFDVRTMNTTMRYQTKSKRRFFFPYGIPIWDTMKMANDTICRKADYIKFCQDNGYMTNHKRPQVRKTAEILWRYLTGDNTFTESHTGLEDVQIEAQIFAECVRLHKKMERAAELEPDDIEKRWVF
jgi:hypothetical protein